MAQLRTRFENGDPAALAEIQNELAKYHFYHRLEVVPGVSTGGLTAYGYKWAEGLVARTIAEMEKLDFVNKRVLDIGCRDGALSFAAERLGATEILGVDNDLSPGLTNFLVPFRGSRLRTAECNVNELTREKFGTFDVVLFAGVLYHLRYPMWALRHIADVLKPGGTLLIEGGFIDGFGDLPVMFCPTEQTSPYEPTSVTFFNEAGVRATLNSLGFTGVQCRASFLYMSRLYTARRWATEFPKFFRRNWWRLPRVCRKIFVCVRSSDNPPPYWDATHALHSGTIKV